MSNIIFVSECTFYRGKPSVLYFCCVSDYLSSSDISFLQSLLRCCLVLGWAAQSWPGWPSTSHLFYSVWSCAVSSENYDKSWSLLQYSVKFLHTVAFCDGELSWLWVIEPIWLLQSIVQEDCWIIGICLLCDLEVNCVLYLSNNANWGNKYQNSDFGQGSHREDGSGWKISEWWIPWVSEYLQ